MKRMLPVMVADLVLMGAAQPALAGRGEGWHHGEHRKWHHGHCFGWGLGTGILVAPPLYNVPAPMSIPQCYDQVVLDQWTQVPATDHYDDTTYQWQCVWVPPRTVPRPFYPRPQSAASCP